MLTVLEMNPEGYVNGIFEGNTLEEFLKDVSEYFSSAGYEDDLEIILEQAKEAYRKEVNEYVYFDANSREDNYFLTYDEAYEHESKMYMDCWYEMNKWDLLDKFKEKLENINLEEMLIDFILNKFNGYNKYNLELIGYEKGRSYWNTVEIKNYDVNEIYRESDDNFLEQVHTGSNVFGHYTTFYENFIEELEEVIQSKKCEIYEELCKDHLERDYFFFVFDEDAGEYINDFTANVEEKIGWEDMKEYVE